MQSIHDVTDEYLKKLWNPVSMPSFDIEKKNKAQI